MSNPSPAREPEERPRGVVRVLWLGLASVFFLGAIPIAVKKFHIDFLPSEAWISQTEGFSSTFCFGAAVLATILFAVDMVRRGERIGTLGNIGMILFIPVFFWFLGSALITMGYPMLRTLWAGQATEMVFYVDSARKSYSTLCRNKIELQRLPFIINSVCGTEDDVVAALKPGSTVTIAGYGTDLGLFVQQVRPGGR